MKSSSKIIFPLCLLLLCSSVSWGLVLAKLNPFQNTGLALGFFFLTLFTLTWSFFTLILIAMKKYWIERDLSYPHYPISARQSFFLSLCLNIWLFLLVIGELNLLLAFLVLLIAMMCEASFSRHDDV